VRGWSPNTSWHFNHSTKFTKYDGRNRNLRTDDGKAQEAVDQYRLDNNDWGDDSELVALTYMTHAYLLKQGWTVSQFIKYLHHSERVLERMG
jgi:hypothetical protein